MTIVMLMWLLAATVLAGAFIVVALVMPEIGTMLHLSEPLVITAAALLGAIVAIPVAIGVTRAILGGKKSA